MQADQGFAMECALELEPGKPLPLFPLLMPDTWQRAPTQVYRPIISGLKLSSVPLIAPVHFIGDPNTGTFQRVYIRTERVESIGKTIADFEREALFNVSRRHASWQIAHVGGARVALCNNDFLACERILDPAFMRQGAELLGVLGGSVLAAVPQRGFLLATPLATDDAVHLRTFVAAVEQLWREPGKESISPWSFMITGDGRTNTILEIE